MKLLHAFTAIFFAASILAAPRTTWCTDLNKALAQAKKEKRMAFILLGRESCGNCQATRKLVNQGEVPVSAENFVIADINTDDPKADAEFLSKFGRDNFG